MQRWWSNLRRIASFPKSQSTTSLYYSHRFLHSSSNCRLQASLFSFNGHSSISPPSPYFPLFNNSSLLIPTSLLQVRHITAKQRKRKLKSRRPATPIVSKVKKIKMKGYSSYKGRFRVMKNGQIRRWKEGKQHNAHLKSKKAKRRLRQPGTVPVAYAKVMKKLNFCA
ncbi:hypothetical protein Leryth_010516 [Lithospermum erythrorhizon]|nr:hypothetical protein Leryth_010516 [Lithospermum erythrorhizon]